MPSILLKEYNLGVSMEQFVEIYWLNSSWYEKFLIDKLYDINVSITEWSVKHNESNSVGGNHNSNNVNTNANISPTSSSKSRSVKSHHPSKISFPGLPSHAESTKLQILETYFNETDKRMVVKEITSFRGIPYADYFNVLTEWKIISLSTSGNTAPTCSVSIYLDFKFLKSTWLQATIESNTKAELMEVFELWYTSAKETIKEMLLENNARSQKFNKIKNASLENPKPEDEVKEQLSVYYTDDEDELQFYDCEDQSESFLTFPSHGKSYKLSPQPNNNSSSSMSSSMHELKLLKKDSSKRFKAMSSDNNAHSSNNSGSNSGSIGNTIILSTAYRDMYGNLITEEENTNSATNIMNGSNLSTSSSRDLAVNVVETMFVLAEFSFWQVHNFYMYDFKELFNVEPTVVMARIINSFIPGWHAPLLIQPDIYGPLLAVFTLPQSLLISMEISKHGCNPTSQLGNAVIVSLLIWIGLSAIYRLFAAVLAPNIGFKPCLSVTGYGFFAWNLALLCYYPLELYKDYHRIPIMLPLVIFGIPSSLAQGCMFWEHTPSSSITLQPNALPTSIQQFANHNSRCLQRLLWAFPKIIAFVVIAVTHYQFLWYMARVFLPGRRQLCRLSALVQPSQYADILTQKELRKFAIKLLLNGRNEEW